MKDVKAQLNNLRIAPRKVRLVSELIKGLPVMKAVSQLTFSKKRSALLIMKLVNSAVANASNNFKLDKDYLYVKDIKVDEGPALKRYMPRARGRAALIKKRTSHITLVLQEQEKKSKARSAKSETMSKSKLIK
ncbi:MAG: 50S ribosomal protein L22 [Parcubacteria group bacterium]|nr:50S ribosomal protein L22 [Parcubacteria group bacterium]MCR4342668.1 50S ribosomal protein L22 [Patescibacteria group bacterium]